MYPHFVESGLVAPPKRTDDWIIIKLCVQARDHLTCLMRDVAFIGSLVSISCKCLHRLHAGVCGVTELFASFNRLYCAFGI
jgi:hypothetical protein